MNDVEILETEVDDNPRPLTIFDLAETDSEAEENGKWFNDIFDDESNINVKIRRMSSKKSMQVRRRLDKMYRSKSNRKGEYPDAVGNEVFIKHLSEGVVVDWNGILDRDGSVVECTPENAERLFKALPTFRDMIGVICANMDSFRVEEADETEKN